MIAVAIRAEDLRLTLHGAERFPGAIDSKTLNALLDVLSDQPADQAGVRLFDVPRLRPLIDAEGPVGRIAATHMAGRPRPVRAILFDKSAATNWSLAWHQDRVIAVRDRIEVPGFGPWSRKDGVVHVAPPFEILAAMRTLRLHLDPVPRDNAPLLIAPGSHRIGRIAEGDVPSVVEACGVAVCEAEAGDAWLYATPILHASEAALAPKRRRVLQVDYAADDLPGALAWLGI